MYTVTKYAPNIFVVKDVIIQGNKKKLRVFSERVKTTADWDRCGGEHLVMFQEKTPGHMEIEVVKLFPSGAYRELLHREYETRFWSTCLETIIDLIGKDKYLARTL